MTPVKASNYKIIIEDNVRDFNTMMESVVSAGWLLYGQPWRDKFGHLYQAVIKP